LDNVGDKVDFLKLRRDAAKFLEDNKQRIHDNPHSIDYVLKKVDHYVDTFRSEIKGGFPIDESLLLEIEQKLPRPKIGGVEQLENASTKNRLISISTRLENELRNYERIINNSQWGEDPNAYNQYKRSALAILLGEKEFLFHGTCLESMISTINQEHHRIERGGSTKTLKSAYQSIRSSSVIDDFKKREEDRIFTKVDQIISTYNKYLADYLNVYQEYYQRYSDVTSPKMETFLPEKREEAASFKGEDKFESTAVKQETYEMAGEVKPETFSKLDEGLEEVGATVEEKVDRQEESRYIKTVTITYNDGYTINLEIPADSREELKAELAKLVF
jgi:hypothetical protein